MMNSIQHGLLMLLKSALTGQKYDLPEDFSIEAAESLIARHQVGGMAYEGAVICGIPKSEPIMRRLFQKYYLQIVRSEKQMAILNELFSAFDQNGIDYLPVKGVNMKLLYPNPAMRIMGDADVLIRMEQYDQIRPLMLKLGFKEGPEVDYELVWEKDVLHLELHKQLLHSKNTDYYRYFQKGWEYAVPVTGSRYTFSNERMYMFLLGHFAKHYRGGGIGLRQTLDLWLYEQKIPLIQEVLEEELKKSNFLEFYTNLKKMLDCWFEDEPMDEKSEYISEYLFNSGSWGTFEQKIVSQGLQESKKKGSAKRAHNSRILDAIFPSLKTMKNRYKVLESAPVLLPLFWPVRWVGALISRRDNIYNYAKTIEIVSVDQIDSFEKSLKYVGLNFDI